MRPICTSFLGVICTVFWRWLYLTFSCPFSIQSTPSSILTVRYVSTVFRSFFRCFLTVHLFGHYMSVFKSGNSESNSHFGLHFHRFQTLFCTVLRQVFIFHNFLSVFNSDHFQFNSRCKIKTNTKLTEKPQFFIPRKTGRSGAWFPTTRKTDRKASVFIPFQKTTWTSMFLNKTQKQTTKCLILYCPEQSGLKVCFCKKTQNGPKSVWFYPLQKPDGKKHGLQIKDKTDRKVSDSIPCKRGHSWAYFRTKNKTDQKAPDFITCKNHLAGASFSRKHKTDWKVSVSTLCWDIRGTRMFSTKWKTDRDASVFNSSQKGRPRAWFWNETQNGQKSVCFHSVPREDGYKYVFEQNTKQTAECLILYCAKTEWAKSMFLRQNTKPTKECPILSSTGNRNRGA